MARHIERFAPSPTGQLHLGHAFSALTAFKAARKAKGAFLLRIEDIDVGRSRPEYEQGIYDDLRWLGIDWVEPALRQSERLEAYSAVVDQLIERGLLYACTCTRKQIAEAAPNEGDQRSVYPGTCRGRDPLKTDAPHALRLDLRKALASLGGGGVIRKLHWKEIGKGPNGEKGKIALDPQKLIEEFGDVILARKDFPASYHLSVVLDDAFQEVTHVTRGQDLFDSTYIHRVLQALTGRSTPIYRHHRLIRDESDKRLAKRDDARAIATLRDGGATAEDVRQLVGF